MVIYTDEKDLDWIQLPEKGLEVALLAHADPGQNHGEDIGLTRAFQIASRFNAIPVDHLLSFELPIKYPDKFEELVRKAGSIAMWLTTTLCVYAGEGKSILPDEHPVFNFGYEEESYGNSAQVVYSGIEAKTIETYNFIMESGAVFNTARGYPDFGRVLSIRVPEELRNKFIVLNYPDYRLQRKENQTVVRPDWEKAVIVPEDKINLSRDPRSHGVDNQALLPDFEHYFLKTKTGFRNPTVGFFAPAEGYRLPERGVFNFWRISTGGEAVIMQRPIQPKSI